MSWKNLAVLIKRDASGTSWVAEVEGQKITGTMTEILNQVGGNDWELVSCVPDSVLGYGTVVSAYRAFFKRSIPPA